MSQRTGAMRGWTRSAGFTLFELIVVIIVVALFSAVLLDRFVRYQALAERAAMEGTVASIRSALNLQMAGLIVKGRQQEIPRLVDTNPFRLLNEDQPNYRGEYFGAADIEPGSWYFDMKMHEAVYVVRQGRNLSGGGDSGQIRFRTALLYNDFLQVPGEPAPEIGGLSFRPSKPYRWEID